MVTSYTYPICITGADMRQAIEQLITMPDVAAVPDEDLVLDLTEDAESLDLYRLACDLLAVA